MFFQSIGIFSFAMVGLYREKPINVNLIRNNLCQANILFVIKNVDSSVIIIQ